MCGKISLKYLYTLLLMIIGFGLFPSMEVKAETYIFNGTSYNTEEAVKYAGYCGTSYYFDDSSTLIVTDWGLHSGASYNSDYPWYSLNFDNLFIVDGITEIPSNAFQSSSVKAVILPETLETIKANAFTTCNNLTNINLPDSIKTIESSVFGGCSKLNIAADMPDSLETIGVSAFNGCTNLYGKLNLPESLTRVDDGAFLNCKKLSGDLVIPNNVSYLGTMAFQDCTGLSGKLVLPNNIEQIRLRTFYGCSGLTGVLVLPKGIKSIADGAFYKCSAFTGDLILPEGLLEIGAGAFECCDGFNGQLRLPDGLLLINDGAFHDCTGFTGELSVPQSVITIGEKAFSGCSNIESLYLQMNSPSTSIGKYAFENMYKLSKIRGNGLAEESTVNGQRIVPVVPSPSVFSIGGYSGVFTQIEDFPTWTTWFTDLWYLSRYPLTLTLSSNVDSKITLVNTQYLFYHEASISLDTSTLPNIPGKKVAKYYYYNGTDQTTFNLAQKINYVNALALTNNTLVLDVIAEYMDITCTVKFKSYPYSGDYGDLGEYKIPYGSLIEPIENPTHSNPDRYKFVQWTLQGKPFDFNTPVTEDITLVADWDFYDYYSIYFYIGDTYGEEEYYDALTFREDELPEPIAITPKEGYTLSPWTYWDSINECDAEFKFDDYLTEDIYLYALWQLNDYTVSFDSGVPNFDIPDQILTHGNTAVEPVLEYEGHTLVGWYTDTGELYSFFKPVTTDLNLTAVWSLNKHTVLFSDNLTGYTYISKVDWGTTVTAPEPPVRNGYNLIGWYTDETGTEPFDFNTPITQDITVYAKWEKEASMYTVIYMSSDGSILDTLSVASGTVLTEPSKPEKDGHTFKGWFSNGVLYDFSQPVTSNLVLMQKWDIITHTVSFDSDGGSTVQGQTVLAGGLASRPNNPIKDGFTFIDWYLGENVFDFTTPVTQDINLTAKWEKNPTYYNVTIIRDVDTDIESFTVAEGATVAEQSVPFKEGYVFKGWFVGKELYDFSTPVTSDLVIVAKWEEAATRYTVKFVSDDKVLSTANVKVQETVTEPKAPTKSGYVFKGWYLGDLKYDFSSPVTKSITLTAQWEKEVVYHQVYFYDGINHGIVKVKDGDKVSEPTSPTKEGYNFKGWCGDSAGKTDNYNFDKEVTSDLWLYARWEEVSNPVITVPETEPESHESEPESQTPSKSEPIPKESEPETKSKESEPETKQSPASKLKDLTPESIEVTETIIEPETESESVEEESFTTEEILEEETEYSSAVAVEPNIPVTLKENKKHHDWLWLILLLLILVLLPPILLLTMRRVKVFVQVSTDNEDEAEFQQIYRTFIETKDKAYQINIPSRVTQDCFSDTFKVLLTEHFVKKHAEEELYVNIDINDEQFSNLFILEEGVVELLFSTHEDTFLQASLDNSEGVTNPPFSE